MPLCSLLELCSITAAAKLQQTVPANRYYLYRVGLKSDADMNVKIAVQTKHKGTHIKKMFVEAV